MAGRRALTKEEERRLLRAVRKMAPRNRALVTAQWMTGFRISEVLSWTVGTVLRNGALVSKIGLPPRNMKGGYGKTRWVPLLPELHRALERYLSWLERRLVLSPDLPLFLSRECDWKGDSRALSSDMARHIIKEAFARAGIEDDGRLGTHTLRKTWTRKVYEASGHDILVVSAGLNHSSIAITQKYLEPDEDDVMAAMMNCDFSRAPRKRPVRVDEDAFCEGAKSSDSRFFSQSVQLGRRTNALSSRSASVAASR
jgi:integrase